MALKLNLILLLMLAFHVSMGSLVLSSTLRHYQVPQGHHFEEHQYHRQSQFQKRQNSLRNEASDRGIFYDKKEDDLKNLPLFGNKRQQRWEELGSWSRWKKRSNKNDVASTLDVPQKTSDLLSKNVASQHMLRTPRNHRTYDVPQIECPQAEDGMDRFACPTPDRMGRYRCIDDHVLCDGFIDCPNAEDEDRQACMFYKTTKAHLDVIADAVLRWARGR